MRLRADQAFLIAAGILLALALTGIVTGTVAVRSLDDARERLVDDIDPALDVFLQGRGIVADQEAGVRAYALTRDPRDLEDYRRARAEGERLGDVVLPILRRPALSAVRDETEAVTRAADVWRTRHLEPLIAAVRRGARTGEIRARLRRGRPFYLELERTIAAEIRALRELREQRRQEVLESAQRLNAVLIGFGGILLVGGLSAAFALRRWITRPLADLAEQSRAVAAGAFGRPISARGAVDVKTLGADMEAMRRRILAEVEELERRGNDLERSNQELEQFAYVASHDLQEPLRKVASFTQLLERRYKGQLDERADQYIAFAVDGAKRMQVLINDLLAFSRVGRIREEHGDVDLGDALDGALRALETAIEESGAEITHDELPVVRGERSLLGVVFQNLIGNSIKFSGDAPPRIHVGCRRDGECYELCVRDEGIGIDPEYADRIFVIFQRLHTKEQYAGTGIGLAMCRKIIEHHGGRVWLDVEQAKGTTFRFTLPVPPENEETEQ